MTMRERMQRFMMGRYGNDKMNQVLSVVSMVLVLAGIFLRVNILYTLGLVLLVYVYFRTFSKNIPKRYAPICNAGESGIFAAVLSFDRLVCRKETVSGTQQRISYL